MTTGHTDANSATLSAGFSEAAATANGQTISIMAANEIEVILQCALTGLMSQIISRIILKKSLIRAHSPEGPIERVLAFCDCYYYQDFACGTNSGWQSN